MLPETLRPLDVTETEVENAVVDDEEFFARTLFDDVLGLKSLRQVCDKTGVEMGKLQDLAYQNLFQLYQKTRGVEMPDKEKDEIFNIFEVFFRHYYQHFRGAMEKLLADRPPVKVAYFLGKNSGRMISMLDDMVREMERDLA